VGSTTNSYSNKKIGDNKMCKFFKFNENSKIIGDCSKIEQDVLCCGDRNECECGESFEDSVFDETPIEKADKSLTELVKEMRKDVADIKVMNAELLKLIKESEDDTHLVSLMENMDDANKIAKRFPDESTNV